MHGEEDSGGEVDASTAVVRSWWENIGAVVMGRNMFGGGPGPWREDWRGWWGENPPYHMPVFVITHHFREPLEMQGGTTFHFVAGGIEAALERATKAAEGKDVWLTGGASVIRQYLRAGPLDEIEISLAPVLLGHGERLLADVEGSEIELEQIRAIEAPGVTHISYRVKARRLSGADGGTSSTCERLHRIGVRAAGTEGGQAMSEWTRWMSDRWSTRARRRRGTRPGIGSGPRSGTGPTG